LVKLFALHINMVCLMVIFNCCSCYFFIFCVFDLHNNLFVLWYIHNLGAGIYVRINVFTLLVDEDKWQIDYNCDNNVEVLISWSHWLTWNVHKQMINNHYFVFMCAMCIVEEETIWIPSRFKCLYKKLFSLVNWDKFLIAIN